jgi:hypothetical protein
MISPLLAVGILIAVDHIERSARDICEGATYAASAPAVSKMVVLPNLVADAVRVVPCRLLS